jgi:hypothetical protein
MEFLRWLGGVVILFWLLGFIFRFSGDLIHLLLIVAAIIFLLDWITGKRKRL